MDHRMPWDACPTCGYAFDCASSARTAGRPPGPGDITLCLACGEVLTFGPDLRTQPVPASVWVALPKRLRRNVIAARVAARELRKRGPLPSSKRAPESS